MEIATCPNSTYFLDVSTLPSKCFDCRQISKCLECSGLTSCTLCQQGYKTSGGGCTKIVCTDPKCNLCSSTTYCLDCILGYQPISGTCTKIPCTDTHCILCSSSPICVACDYMNSYYILTNNTCDLCQNSSNMFINMSNTSYPCVACNKPIGCLQCLNLN